jgi:hypothetical protein
MKTCAIISLLLGSAFMQTTPLDFKIPSFPQVSTSSLLAGVGSSSGNNVNDILKSALNEVPNGLSDLNIGGKQSQLRSV